MTIQVKKPVFIGFLKLMDRILDRIFYKKIRASEGLQMLLGQWCNIIYCVGVTSYIISPKIT